jgi:ureidoacrylate peracid hydrolase
MTSQNHRATDPFSAKQSGEERPAVPPTAVAVVVVDMMKDFVEADGAMPLPGSAELVPKINRLVDAARSAGAAIVWAKARYPADDALFRKRVPHCIEGTSGAELVDGLLPRDGDYVVHKRRYSAFYATDLDLWLREHRVERIVLCGLATNICVRATAHDGFFHGYQVDVVEDACMATGPREQESTLYDIQTHFGEVRTLDDVVAGVTAR